LPRSGFQNPDQSMVARDGSAWRHLRRVMICNHAAWVIRDMAGRARGRRLRPQHAATAT
jgi:hypothetical protein